MEEKIIDMEVTYKSRWEKFKHKVANKWNRFKNWCRTYPEYAVTLFLGALVAVDKIHKKWKNIQPTQAELDRRWHETHIYDRSTGTYFEIRRPMTATEAQIFSHRKGRGEYTADILMSMKLLK